MPFLLATLLVVTHAQDVTSRAPAVIASLRAGDFSRVEAQFDDKRRAALPPGQLDKIWSGLALQLGALKACAGGEARVVAIADKQMVITPCEFERAKADVQLAFDPAGRIWGFTLRPAAAPHSVPYTPPPYATPSAFSESALTVGSGEWALPGTLTVPSGAGPYPAVVLVHGSGPNDRDETIGPNQPFADLAAGLASRGVAVLRYEKRSRAHGPARAALASMTVIVNAPASYWLDLKGYDAPSAAKLVKAPMPILCSLRMAGRVPKMRTPMIKWWSDLSLTRCPCR